MSAGLCPDSCGCVTPGPRCDGCREETLVGHLMETSDGRFLCRLCTAREEMEEADATPGETDVMRHGPDDSVALEGYREAQWEP